MFVERIKGPRCQKCGETMALRIIEPERPGFDSRTFECPKCFGTETLVASISCGLDVSAAPSPQLTADYANANPPYDPLIPIHRRSR